MADPHGNERLTAMTGAVLLVLFIVECMTLLNLGNMLTLHVFLGFLLLGPVSLKIGSTLWRFTRYYTGSAPYVKKGPPAPLQRVLGPLVILTTVTVLGSGVALVLSGSGPGQFGWHRIHQLSFLVWAAVIVVHVGSYLPRLPRLLTGKAGQQARSLLAASATRWLLLCGSLAAGAIVAVLAYHLSANWGG
ncbi:MAG TPA: hypothetical protein VN969_28080 [Streptosporangiaceae bacterium]|jgi:hypothetical protein|nr:hypothetical protein [Streptosporangiaceae bacterium]